MAENAEVKEEVKEEEKEKVFVRDYNSPTCVSGGPLSPRKAAPKFKQRQSRQFKSKPPKKGVSGFGDDIPGMEGLGTDITVICPWEAFNHLELNELAKYGII